VFHWEIPPEAARPQPDVKEGNRNRFWRQGCNAHGGKRSVEDPGLAHRIVGRLGISRGRGDAVKAGAAGSPEASRTGVIDVLAASVKNHVRRPRCVQNTLALSDRTTTE
jgi:hypothetical protein